uniref:Uncharacterized protein n=1 Tax=Steinernema glaseri TaxID=37863 RepID=A0A1I7ZMS1_9BILA
MTPTTVLLCYRYLNTKNAKNAMSGAGTEQRSESKRGGERAKRNTAAGAVAGGKTAAETRRIDYDQAA